MKSIAEELKEGKVLVSDGAWGTFLQQMGLQPGECPELWNLEHPEKVLQIAQSYIDAGSDMIETNSFGGSSFKLANYGLADRVFEINKAAAEISRKAAGPEKHVLGSIGPTGKMIVMGDVTYEELYEAFKEQAKALEAGGADALVIETMTDLEEAKAAVKACNENTNCEVICTMTFDPSPDNQFYTMMGVTPAQMVEEMLAAGAHIIGANCGNGMKNMIGIVEEIREVNSEIPVLVHANAGNPVYHDGETRFLETPEQMAGLVGQLVAAGANIVGGCCGTTPEHIRQMSQKIRKLNHNIRNQQMNTEEILNKLSECVEFGKVNKTAPFPPSMKGQDGADELARQAVEMGIKPDIILYEALIKAMEKVGEKFSQKKIFVPQMLISAKAMNAALNHLKPFFQSGEVKRKGKFIIGTVAGDLHDIGKNLVAMIVEGAGWEVIDLGVDVSSAKFISAIKTHPGAVVGLSALLTTTMISMKKIVADIQSELPGTNILIGGAPVTDDFRKEIGASAYSRDPQGAVSYLNALVA